MLSSISNAVTDWVAEQGVYAVFILMLADALLPAAGELVMLYAGALASGAVAASPSLFGWELASGLETYLVLSLAGTIGYLVGSWLGWGIGRFGGRTFVERYGRWIHLGPHRLVKAQRWFDQRGRMAVLIGRLVPVVRSFISVAAGVFRSPLGLYSVLTLVGSAIWCFAFAAVGWGLGESWEKAHHAFEISVIVGVVLVAIGGIGYLVVRRRRQALSS